MEAFLNILNAVFCIFCVFIAGTICIAVYKSLVKPNRLIKKAKSMPAICTQAVVISKSQKIVKVGYSSESELYLVFELADGTRIDFLVDTSTYNTTMEGEKGILTYHELNDTRFFVSFQRTK